MTDVPPPHSPEAEQAVVGRIMSEGTKLAGRVVGSTLEPPHFYSPALRVIFEACYEAYYADEPMDPLTIGEQKAKSLSRLWNVDEREAIRRVRILAEGQSFSGNVIDHAKLIKRDSDYRLLLGLAESIKNTVKEETKSPEELAGIASQRAMRIATNSLLTADITSFGDLGKQFINQLREMAQARADGVEMGAHFALRFLDDYMKGLQPTELWILGGEPGAGKSAVAWIAGQNFAERQMPKPKEDRVATLVLSLEMGDLPSKMRIAQALTGIDSGKMREGDVTPGEIDRIINEWAKRQEIPYYFNFTSSLRASQLRAICVEAIRRHNVGMVIIDHFRYFDMDERYERTIDEDEAKARFLKEAIAKDLNLAVVCLAHTTKGFENNQDRRPTLSNLRGSGQVAAHADFVSFVHRPYKYASDEDKAQGTYTEVDAEMIWAKSRHSLDGVAEFYFEPSKMRIR